jgi:hypothetical protein
MWMMNEGIYLNLLLSFDVFNNSDNKITAMLYIIGWGFPALFTITWAIFAYIERGGVGYYCWIAHFTRPSYWIIKAPILVSLIVILNPFYSYNR